MEPAIDIERFAALSAELDAGTPRDELCAREKLSVEAWVAAQEIWLARIADETSRKRFVLTNRYNTAFVARRRAITHAFSAPRTASAAPAHRAARHPEATARPAAPQATPPQVAPSVAPPPMAQPTFERPTFERPTFESSPPPPIAYRSEPPAPPAPVAPAPVAPAPARRVQRATMAMPAFEEPKAALPFAPSDEPARTQNPLAVSRAALPFQAPPAAPTPKSTAPAAPPINLDTPIEGTGTVTGVSPIPRAAMPFTPVQEGAAPKQGHDSTAVGAISPFATGAALPFQAAQPGSAAQAKTPSVPPPAARRPSSSPPPAEGAGKPRSGAEPAVYDGGSPGRPGSAPMPPVDTTVVGAISPFAAGGPALPFARAAQTAPATQAKPLQSTSAGLPFQQAQAQGTTAPPKPAATPRLTLEQFASLTAEIAVNPRAAAQIRARYGLDEAAHRAEAEAHNRRFASDKAMYDRYLELFQSFRDYVARSQR